MRLTERLHTVAELVPACHRLIDIGTDHARLPIELVKAGRCSCAIAADINAGPIAAAERNICAAGLEQRVTTHRGDGLDGLSLQANDVLVIAGLGGYEIMSILADQPRLCQSIVLQPMKSLPELRLWLAGHGYEIDKERLAVEKNRFYVVLGCRYTGQFKQLDSIQAVIGPRLLVERPAGFACYLARLADRLHKQLHGDPALKAVLDWINQLEETKDDDEP